MIKRIHSMIMALLMAFTLCFVPLISGCSESGKLADENRYTVAQWLSIVEDGFGMDYYTNQEPVMQNVLRDDSRFDTVQVAVEWGLISADDGLDLDSTVTKEFCADTLVKATNFRNSGFEEISDESKINPKYLENVKVALNNGIFSLNSGKFDPTKVLDKQEADLAFDIAHDKWVNFTFDGSYDNSVVKDNVINFGGVDSGIAELAPISPSDYTIEYSGSRDFFAGGSYSDTTSKTVTFKAGAVPDGLTEGSVLSFPYNDVIPMDFAVVVDSIVTNADGSVTVKTHNATLLDVYETLDIHSTEDVNFDEARVFDANGVEILPASGTTDLSLDRKGVYIDDSRPGMYIPGSAPQIMKTGVKNKNTYEVDLGGGFKVTVTTNGDEISLKLNAVLAKGKNGSTSLSLSESFSSSVTKSIDWKGPTWNHWLPRIESALFKCDFKTKSNVTLSAKASNSKDEIELKDINSADGQLLSELYEALASVAKSDMEANSKIKQSCSKKICSVALGPYGFNFDVRLKLSLEGTISFSLDLNGTFGAEYRDGHLQKIGKLDVKRQLDLSGKAEATLFAGISWGLLGFTVIDIGADFGLGAAAKMSMFQKSSIEGVYDAECALPMAVFCGETPQSNEATFENGIHIDVGGIDTCLNIKIYPILNLAVCTKDCLIGDILGVGMELKILGEDNPFFNLHWENGSGWSDSCSRGASNAPDITVGSDLKLNLPEDRQVIRLFSDEEYKELKITELPKGISADEVTVSVDNGDIVNARCLLSEKDGWLADIMKKSKLVVKTGTVQDVSTKSEFYFKEPSKKDMDHFILTGLSDGTAKLTISAGTYSKVVDVIVGNGGIEKVTEGRFVVETSTLNLKGTQSQQIIIGSLPEGYSLADFEFKSNKPDVATVDQAGNVTAKNIRGNARITITSKDGKYEGGCSVNVIPE